MELIRTESPLTHGIQEYCIELLTIVYIKCSDIKVLTLLIKSHAHAFILAPCLYYTMPIALVSERKQIQHGVVSRVNRTWEILTTTDRAAQETGRTSHSRPRLRARAPPA